MKFFENRKLKGAISIFLIIITIPTILFSAVLIDGSRMASARAMVQEAADLAAVSALASYDQELKDQFGLFAIDDYQNIEEVYKESLNATLLAYGMSGDEEYSERIWEIMKTTLGGEKSYMGESFLNLYDFAVDGCDVEPKYCLAEQSVLENQMVEYSKFRGLYVMTDRMDIFSMIGQAKQEAEQNQVAAEVMEEKMDTDQSNVAADKALKELRDEVESLNGAIKNVETAKQSYLRSLRGKMEQIRIENIDTDERLSSGDASAAGSYDTDREDLKEAAEAACKQAGEVFKQAEKTKKEVENAIDRLEKFQSKNQSKASGNETVETLMQESAENIETYKNDYLSEIQKLLDNPTLNRMKADTGIKSELNTAMTGIHKAITAYIEVIKQLREAIEEQEDEDSQDADGGSDDSGEEDSEDEEITEYYYYYLNNSGSTEDANTAINGGGASRCYAPAVGKPLDYFIRWGWDSNLLNPSRKYGNTPGGKISEQFAEGQSGQSGNPETNLEGAAAKGEIDATVYNARPSKSYVSEQGKENNTAFYNKENDLAASKGILQKGKRSMILDMGEAARDDVLCLTYMFGTFKTRLTGVKKFSSQGMSDSDKKSFYMPKWRYAHPDGELDMRFAPKKDRETVLRSEIEYLVYGNRSDSANEAAVYATIFAERLANNMIALYSDKKGVNATCHAAAGTASLATFGTVPEPVFFWIFLTAWATAETILEMHYLISGGYKIPLLKNSKNILLTLDVGPGASGDGLLKHYGKKGIFVSYEDYLLILLLIKGKEKRIMRSADLIEMNMKKNGSADFTMAKAYTYLHADTKLSIRYLFGSVKPFQSDYEKNGHSGRMHFTNTIYMGY